MKKTTPTNWLIFMSIIFLVPQFAISQSTNSTTPASFSLEKEKTYHCGFEIRQRKNLLDPNFKSKQEEIEQALYENAKRIIKERLKDKKNTTEFNNPTAPCETGANANLLRIPLLVNIIHLSSEPNPGDGPSNPTDTKIQQGVQDLNDAYRNLGAYSGHSHHNHSLHPELLSVDVEIEFVLAQRDINGNATTGIIRHQSDLYSDLNMDTEDPDMQIWVDAQNGGVFPNTDYTNIWLVNEICMNMGTTSIPNPCGVGGYADFPGGHGTVANGIVNLANSWGGSSNASKIHIHEFGHYFNLSHTWANGCVNNDCLTDGDKVCDTPPDNSTSSSACGSAANTCTTDADDTSSNNPFTTDVDDLYENYMDYSSSSCQNTFTQGQKDRMRAALLGPRSSLLNSIGGIPLDPAEAGILSVVFPNPNTCSTSFSPKIKVVNSGTGSITSLSIASELDGVAQASTSWTGTIPSGGTLDIILNVVSFTGTGSHNLFVELTNVNGIGLDNYNDNDAICQVFQYSNSLSSLPSCEDVESGSMPSDWIISNPDSGVGFEVYNIATCATNGNDVVGLQTWATFPSQTTTDAIYTQVIDLTAFDDAQLEFDVAYATTYGNFNTILDVSISQDCGVTYTSFYNKTGGALSTASRSASGASDPAAFFTPTDCSEWRTESIDLTQYSGSEILIRYQASTEDIAMSSFGYYWGNNLYLDNFCLTGTSCTNFTTLTSSPQSVCNSLVLSADGSTLNANETIGWWITQNAPITNTATNSSTAASALAAAQVGGTLSAGANVIYNSDPASAPPGMTLNFDCANLTSSNYYATPFISQEAAAVADVNCNVNSGASLGITFGGDPGKFTRINPNDICRPANPPNPPVYDIVVTITGYTGATANHRLIARDNNYNGNTLQFITISGNGTYNFDETDFPGYDPGLPGGTSGMTFISWEQGGSGMGNATIAANIDITYEGTPAIPFPQIEFTDCTFGTPVEFTCNCPCPDVDDIADQNVVGGYVLPTITGSNLTGNEAYYTGSNGTGSTIPVGTSITTNSTIYIYDFSPQCNDEESFTVTIITGQGSCSTNLLMVNNPINAGTYNDADSIHSLGDVNANIGLINFIGGHDVKLLPGFHAKSGSDFHAYISACTSPLVTPNDGNEEVLAEKRNEDIEDILNSDEPLQLTVSPNPFNQITTLEYYLPENSNIRLTVTDLLGKPVKAPETWYSESGWFKKEFNGSTLSDNMYYLILQTENNIITKKILIIK